MKQSSFQALEQFVKTAARLQENWDESFERDYPFDEPFDEMVDNLLYWLVSVRLRSQGEEE